MLVAAHPTQAGRCARGARGVLSFDVCDDGSVVYCDGRTIVHLANDGEKTTLAKSKIHIDELVVLRT